MSVRDIAKIVKASALIRLTGIVINLFGYMDKLEKNMYEKSKA